MAIGIRPAKAQDVASAVPLLLGAGNELLISIFGAGDAERAEQYLTFAWERGSGQYGFRNHWVACIGKEIVGLVTCWHDNLATNFDQDTLRSITDYFGLDNAMNIVMQSEHISAALQPPTARELAIGHLCVATKARRRGVATALIQYMESEAQRRKKPSLVLDVEQVNTSAIQFYLGNGFIRYQVVPPFIRMTKALIPL
ncbi:GNAT family N-acetyltransferase [Alteromonas pelagimontana]|uniref:GNAT family N-acetyltransferase n=1 Tax=Alteromonas pelagimontana TaxID=1858656 RepID=A0A6M4MCI5_9ALTE|nr:GNAT family N-acetyltransferase [Alteromonas pelagimontana]QJR80853.1 GNAT family N-acetyltransferase [Alteromonas pelagimontana]